MQSDDDAARRATTGELRHASVSRSGTFPTPRLDAPHATLSGTARQGAAEGDVNEALRLHFVVVHRDAYDGPLHQRALEPYRSVAVSSPFALHGLVARGGVLGVVLDIGDDLTVVDALRANGDQTPILVLSALDDRAILNHCHLRGITCLWREGCEASVRAFAHQAAGEGAADSIEAALGTICQRYALTSTQARVLSLATRVRGHAGVAAELGISVRTAETHMLRILAKTGYANREMLVADVLRLAGSRPR
jgi:DNA-binding NarL/FixJ family response regulator